MKFLTELTQVFNCPTNLKSTNIAAISVITETADNKLPNSPVRPILLAQLLYKT
jgi:hypothetical protein